MSEPTIDAETMQAVRDVVESQRRIRELEVLVAPVSDEWREAVSRELRIGSVKAGLFKRREGESIADHVQRMFLHELFVGASDAELSEVTGAQLATVRDVRESYAKSKQITSLLAEARAVHELTCHAGRLTELIRDALKLYLDTHRKSPEEREAVRSERNAKAMERKSAPRTQSDGSSAAPESSRGAPRRGADPASAGDGKHGAHGAGVTLPRSSSEPRSSTPATDAPRSRTSNGTRHDRA